MKGLQSAGFEVVGPRVSGRGGLSELDSLYEEFDAFLAGIRNEISRRFNGAVVCVTKAIQSIALTAQGSAEESDAWTCERAEAVGRSLSWDEHDINGLVAEATSFTKVSRAMLSMPSSVDKLSTGVSSTVKRLVRDPIVKSGFPLHFRLLHLSLVAATNSASPERSFSAVKRLMRQTRQSTTSSHLADLVITAKEGPECNDDVTVRDIAREMARRFMAKRKRRILHLYEALDMSNIFFVGSRAETMEAIAVLLRQSTQWDAYVRHVSYIGQTRRLARRLENHNKGLKGAAFTRLPHLRPWGVLAYVVGFDHTTDKAYNRRFSVAVDVADLHDFIQRSMLALGMRLCLFLLPLLKKNEHSHCI
ncbi:hypothetical protein FOZ60_014930 [Perkinsus olseni]|uniref:Uncharacterized protein n=1 Tax=Perkinsus olseni TaxID=32597 RepID=A0A7J6N6J5_PEROL|nr:hypothetical protein FOZ60_014930 [Perkinsus olseni]